MVGVWSKIVEVGPGLLQIQCCSSHKSSQVKSTRVASQVKSLLFFSSQVKSFFPSSHLKSVWCSVFPFCKVTKIFCQLRGHLNDRT